MYSKTLTSLLLLLPMLLPAQQSLEYRGYLKELSSFTAVNPELAPLTGRPETYWDHLLHQRLDISWFGKKGWKAGLGWRNRIFFGYTNLNDPTFAPQLDRDYGLVDLSLVTDGSSELLWHSIIDRAWVEWSSKKLVVRAGRQRVNWGIHTIWNPHDLFNQYNFFDFDYEERPGTDAVTAQYYLKSLSSVEVAAAPGRTGEEAVYALRYRFNRRSTDWQVVAGSFQTDWTLGVGWAANLWGMSFKAEGSWFGATRSHRTNNFLLASSLDYLFSNNLFVTAGWLYNAEPGTGVSGSLATGAQTLRFSAKNPWPFSHTLLLQTSYPVHPLVNLTLAAMGNPSGDFLILVPAISWSVRENLDLYLAAQVFGSPLVPEGNLSYLSSSTFLRLKYSF